MKLTPALGAAGEVSAAVTSARRDGEELALTGVDDPGEPPVGGPAVLGDHEQVSVLAEHGVEDHVSVFNGEPGVEAVPGGEGVDDQAEAVLTELLVVREHLPDLGVGGRCAHHVEQRCSAADHL